VLWRRVARPESDLRESARAFSVPARLLFGVHDPAIPVARDGSVATRTIPGARFVSLPCGHGPFAELPERFLAEVDDFVVNSTGDQVSRLRFPDCATD
jgi:pimeloyl-ACP methyl ester carboxylesterase